MPSRPTAPPNPVRRTVMTAAACATLGLPRSPRAQAAFPARPITLVVPFAPGGIADLTARAVARAMGESLHQPVMVENKPGAGSTVAGTQVARAAADGHTLLLVSNGNAVSARLFRKLPFDIVRDFAPIGTLAFFELAVLADARSRFTTLAEALAFARAHPGKLTVGTIAIGSTQHLSAELFKARTGIDALVVPYQATPAVLAALRSGEIDVAFEILGPVLPQVRAGTVRALAVTGAARHPALPAVPTVRESGIADYEVASWNGLAAPAGTPAPIVERLSRAAHDAVASREVRAAFESLGVRGEAGTPQALAALLASEIERWGAVIAAAKIEPK